MDQNLFEKYTKTFGTRFSGAQKKRFAATLQEDLQDAGYEVTPIKGKKLISRSTSYFYGSMKNMKTIIVVPYDTPERKFWIRSYYFPFNGSKTMSKNMIATFAPLVILYIFIFAVLFGGKTFVTTALLSNIVSITLFLLVLLMVYIMLHGIRNTNNVTRYSSSVAMAVSLAKRLDKDEKKRVAFLFTDKNKTKFLGTTSSFEEFARNNKKPNTICLDSIGSGDEIQIAYINQNRKMASEVASYFPEKKKRIETVKLTDDMRMNTQISTVAKSIMIASGTLSDDGILTNMNTATGKDHTADREVLDQVEEMLYRYLHTQK